MNFPVAPQSKNPSSTISMPFCFSLEIFMGKYMVFRSTRVTRHWAIDKVIGGTDVETVPLFKNPHRLPPGPSLLLLFLVVTGDMPRFFANETSPFFHQDSLLLGGHCINVHSIRVSLFLEFP